MVVSEILGLQKMIIKKRDIIGNDVREGNSRQENDNGMEVVLGME